MSGVPKLVYMNLCWMILSVLKLHGVETAQEKWKCNLQDILTDRGVFFVNYQIIVILTIIITTTTIIIIIIISSSTITILIFSLQ